MNPELIFIEHRIEAYVEALASHLTKDLLKIVVHGQGNIFNEFMAKAEKLAPNAQFFWSPKADICRPLDNNTVVFLLEDAAVSLSAMLMDYANATSGVIYAPVTEHHMTRRSPLVNSIPKAGTHLLIELMKAMGFQCPHSEDLPMNYDRLKPGHYYSLQHMTREHLAQPRQRFELFINAFCNNPVIFMIRDPREVAVSLAHYLQVQTDYHVLQSYFANWSKEERLLAVIRGDYPLPIYINRNMRFNGNIRDLFMAYADWIRHPMDNTIVLRFEDLIGPKGGGDHQKQLQSIWTTQLALHVSGSPGQFADQVFSSSSVTFRKGQIGSHKKEFTKSHQAAFDSLCSDYLQLFGYDKTDIGSHDNYPLWRRFHGEIKNTSKDVHPTLVGDGYLGYNLINYSGSIWALEMAVGPIDFANASVVEDNMAKGSLLCAATVDGACAAVDRLLDRRAFEARLSTVEARLDSISQRLSLLES